MDILIPTKAVHSHFIQIHLPTMSKVVEQTRLPSLEGQPVVEKDNSNYNNLKSGAAVLKAVQHCLQTYSANSYDAKLY